VFTAMSGDAEHFKGRQWSINFRVSDLDAMVSRPDRMPQARSRNLHPSPRPLYG
jgi:hypothetical protein